MFNTVGLSWFVAAVRWLLHALFARWVVERAYDNPAAVGYLSWLELPRLGVLAFRRAERGLPLQYRW